MGAMADLRSFAWPASRLSEAVAVLAHRAGLAPEAAELREAYEVPQYPVDEAVDRSIGLTAKRLGLEVEPVEASYSEVEPLVRRAAPALLRLPLRPGDNEMVFLVLLKGGRWRISVIGPDLAVRRLRSDVVRSALCAEIEIPLARAVDRLLTTAGVPEHRMAHARKAILREQLCSVRIPGCWILRLPPGVSIMRQASQARLVGPLVALIAAYLVQQAFNLGGWWLIGLGAFRGHFDWGWLQAWALLLFTGIPVQVLMTWAQSSFSIGVGALFKLRLLYGTLQLEPEEIRHQGAGQFLGRVMESETVENLALGGGFQALVSVIQLFTAAGVLALGAGGWPHALLLLGWTGLTVVAVWLYYRRSRTWIDTYRKMTNDLVERMVGHRTRLAQEDPRHWHADEDRDLARYANLSQRQGRLLMLVNAVVPRGWLIVGFVGVAQALILGSASSAQLAISVGAVILGSQALNSLVNGMVSVVGVMLARDQVEPVFRAASRPALVHQDGSWLPMRRDGAASGTTMLQARDLVFRYRPAGHAVLNGCSLHIRYGDRLLLEGPSGGGKSTLAALLSGLRTPESGLLLLWGFYRQSVSAEEWRRHVVTAPQFHENHVLAETFAFNLLMGRSWPARAEDLDEAVEICRELGLGDLLERMPAGLQQMVGESGWQLSHGERSRLYIARALLQGADLIVLDESFAALDPENLHRAMQCVLNRAPTLLVIAHP
jgi:ATP-binding cassette subfamily B protein